MLAGEVLDADQLAFEAGQCVGVEVQIITDALQLRHGLVELDAGRVQQGIHLGETGVVRGFALQAAAQVLETRTDGGVAGDRIERVFAYRDQRSSVGMTTMAGIEFGQGIGCQWLGIEFFQLELQGLVIRQCLFQFQIQCMQINFQIIALHGVFFALRIQLLQLFGQLLLL